MLETLKEINPTITLVTDQQNKDRLTDMAKSQTGQVPCPPDFFPPQPPCIPDLHPCNPDYLPTICPPDLLPDPRPCPPFQPN